MYKRQDEKQRSDGYGVARFNKKAKTVTFECWPRFADVAEGDGAQFPGWPITVKMSDNDGRKVVGTLPAVDLPGVDRPVIQVLDEATNEIVYTVRVDSGFEPPVYAAGRYTVKAGKDRADTVILAGHPISES